MSLMITENTFEIELIREDTMLRLELFANVVIIFSYPFNFFIYCIMSRQFRQTFCQLCAPQLGATGEPVDGAGGRELPMSQYVSLPTENGNNGRPVVLETKL